jgi:steroid 5-alpha reductase family enzyme
MMRINGNFIASVLPGLPTPVTSPQRLICRRLDPFYNEKDEPWFTGPAKYPFKLLGFWSTQALWEWAVLLPVTAAQASKPEQDMSAWGCAGFVLFMFFFLYETAGEPTWVYFARSIVFQNRLP